MSARTPDQTRRLTPFFALASGVIDADIYHSQPRLAAIASSFGFGPTQPGFLVTLPQLGYACGLLLIVPLGDVLNRHTLILSMLLLTVVALLAVVLQPPMQTIQSAQRK